MKRRLGKLALIVLCICVAPIPSHLLVALLEGHETLYDPGVYCFLLVPSLISFISFTTVRAASFVKKQVLCGFILSGLAVVCVPLLAAFLLAEFRLEGVDPTFVFWPALAIYLLPLFTPIFVLSWLGTLLVFGRKKNSDGDTTKSRSRGRTHAHPAYKEVFRQ